MIYQRLTLLIVVIISLASICCGIKKSPSALQWRPDGQMNSNHLWAGMTVNHSLFTPGSVDQMLIEFSVFNDGKTTVAANPCISRSTLVVNGNELSWRDAEWFAFNLANGLRSGDPLAAGVGSSFGKSGMGRLFHKPGLYNVVWKSDCFEAQPVSFRVMAGDK